MGEGVAVLGAGSWGTAISLLLASNGKKVRLWARSPEFAAALDAARENKRYLPGVFLPPTIEVTSDIAYALKDQDVIVLAVPSQSIREVSRLMKPFLRSGVILVNAAKGLERTTCLRMSQVISEELPEHASRIAVLSGPSHAEEVARKMPTAVVVASLSQEVAEYVQDVFMSSYFRVYTNSDIIGVELGGALKNIIALGAGIADGLGYGDNTKAALLTRGLTEIARLGVALGANPVTFLGLTGVGDLVVTATSVHSRNRRAGYLLGKGFSLEEALAEVGMVVEGVETTKAARLLSLRHQVEMPITEQMYAVLFEGLEPERAVSNLMLRPRRHEVEDIFVVNFYI